MSIRPRKVSNFPRLTRDRIVEAAVALADKAGIAELTMRRLGAKLGVEAMTLYYYAGKKDDLLAAMVDVVVGKIELPSSDLHWKAALRRSAISAHAVLVQHRWAANLILAPRGPDPAHLRYMNAILGTLRRAGFSVDATHHA